MEKIKIELELTPGQNARLAGFLLTLEQDGDVARAPAPELEQPATTPEEPDATPATEPKVTHEQLRLACGKKVDKHRDEILALLKKYGAANVGGLKPEHLDAMYAEVEALK